MSELKPCPFCGSKDVGHDGNDYVECNNCNTLGPTEEAYSSADKWNTRPTLWQVVDRDDKSTWPEIKKLCLLEKHDGSAFIWTFGFIICENLIGIKRWAYMSDLLKRD